MKRFRVTLLVVCLVLSWLGYSDLSLFLRNSEPQQITISNLEAQGPAREWVNVSGGYQDLLQAINMSGTMEIDSFLVPLKSSPESQQINVWFETRDPQIVDLLKTWYFKLNSEEERQQFLTKNQDFFTAQRNINGMTADSGIADSNQGKLKELLQEMNLPASNNVTFISEGKKPESLRGFFFAAIALCGLLKLAFDLKSGRKKQ